MSVDWLSVQPAMLTEIEKFDRLPEPRADGPTAFVSIMEGCSKYCTYCVVPYTRGEEISRPFDDVIAEVAILSHLQIEIRLRALERFAFAVDVQVEVRAAGVTVADEVAVAVGRFARMGRNTDQRAQD